MSSLNIWGLSRQSNLQKKRQKCCIIPDNKITKE